MKSIIIFLILMMFLGHVQAYQQESQWRVAVLIDNSSTTADEERPEAMKNIHAFLAALTRLRDRKATRDIEIFIVLSTLPNRISWMGSPSDLRKDAEKVMKMINFRESCTDLGLGLEEIDTAITISPPKRLDIFVLSKLINVPFSECGEKTLIKLPQDVPAGFLLGKLARQANSTNLFLVHDDQKRTYLDYLRGLGLKRGSFDIRGMTETSRKLSQGRILK